MSIQSNKTHSFILCIIMLICLRSAAVCQDTSRVGLKGLSFGVSLGNQNSISSGGFYGKYWLNEQFVPVAGISFNVNDNTTIYRSSSIPPQRSYFANFSALIGVEYHLLKNQQFSPFARFTVSPYFSTVAGYNSSGVFDSGAIFSNAGFGIECFIIPRLSISIVQNIQCIYTWGNGAQLQAGIGDGKAFSISSGSTNLQLHIYF